MKASEIEKRAQFLVDSEGKRTAVVITLADWQQLLNKLEEIQNLEKPLPTYEETPPIEIAELELAYQEANDEIDSAWELAIADGLADETW